MGLLVWNNAVGMENFEGEIWIDGYNIVASSSGIVITMVFQFFGSSLVIDFLYKDLRGDMRWRLFAAPVSVNTHVFAGLLASMIFLVFSSVLLLGFGVVFYDAYLFNRFILAATLLVTSFYAQLFGMLLFLIVPKKAAAELFIMASAFAMAIGGGLMIGELNLGRVGNFIFQHVTPLALAIRAVQNSGFFVDNMPASIFNFTALVAMTAGLAVVVFLLGRRRRF